MILNRRFHDLHWSFDGRSPLQENQTKPVKNVAPGSITSH